VPCETDVGCDFDFNFLRCCCGGFGVCRQKLSGPDDSIAFLSAGGTIVFRQLNDGETITVDSRSVLAYDETVQLGLSLNGKCCTCLCGGEGMLKVKITLKTKPYTHFIDFVDERKKSSLWYLYLIAPKAFSRRLLLGQVRSGFSL
jgi:hypothetical protein